MKKLDKNIASLFCNEIAHCKLSRFCNFVAPLYFTTTAFIAISLSVCLCVCVCVCVCVCLHARLFPSIANGFTCLNWCQGQILMYSSAVFILQTFADLFTQNFLHLRLHLQNSKISTQPPTGIKIIQGLWCRWNNEWMDIYWYKPNVSQPSTDIDL